MAMVVESPIKSDSQVGVRPHQHPVVPEDLTNRLRGSLSWWRKHASGEVVRLIAKGVPPNWVRPPPLRYRRQHHYAEEEAIAKVLIQDYLEWHAVVRLPDTEKVPFLMPWFIITKTDVTGEIKHRLICNARAINEYLYAPRFTLATVHTMFPALRRGMWAASIDIKHAYFHMGLHPELAKYVVIEIDKVRYRFRSACFGLSPLPYLWMSIMNVVTKLARAAGILIYVYLDDIFILGSSQEQVRRHVQMVLNWLRQGGLFVNLPKSVLEPVQRLEHLGVLFDFVSGCLKVPPKKLKACRKDIGQFVTKDTVVLRKAAAVLGRLKSLLVAVPALRCFCTLLQDFTNQAPVLGWNTTRSIPSALVEEVLKCKNFLHDWGGRPFLDKPFTRELASDSSQLAWGGLDLGNPLRMVHAFWREAEVLHINVKELKAAVVTLKSLAAPGDHVLLQVDNSVTYSYLKKLGGRKTPFNLLVQDLVDWCLRRRITWDCELVPSQDMPADAISRWTFDPRDTSLDYHIYQRVKYEFRHWCRPTWDMWASPDTTKEPLFVSRWEHYRAARVDALACSLANIHHCYACPPWGLIHLWLSRVARVQDPKFRCLLIVPWWASSHWMPLVMTLRVAQSPVLAVSPRWGLFKDCRGRKLPPPRWPLLCVLLSPMSTAGAACPRFPSDIRWIG